MRFDFSALRVAVVGDLILDRYVEGSVDRISPEAPVAVLLRSAERDVLGGAANVAANLAALGASVDLIGLVGADADAAALRRLLDRHPAIDPARLVVDPGRPTTCKTRMMSGFHQLMRIDAESNGVVHGAVEDALVEAVAGAVRRADVVVVSDYLKGVCSDRVIRAAIELAAAAGRPSVVDPKRPDFALYRGASVVKPNRRELTAATGLRCGTDEEAHLAARAAIERTGSSILLTRSELGMSWFGAGGDVLHLPTAARDVFDVSGAGDTAAAVAALGIAGGLPTAEILRLANVAAGIVVGKVGTAVVTKRELEAAVAEEAHHPSLEKGRLVGLDGAARQCDLWRRDGLEVGFTNGCFDLLHPGHVRILRAAAAECDRLVVAINTDASVRRLKGPQRPIQDQAARATVLGAMSAVDLVVLFDEDTPFEAISALRPSVLVKGADYSEEQVVGADIVKAGGGRLVLVPLVEGQSSTAMIRRSAGSA